MAVLVLALGLGTVVAIWGSVSRFGADDGLASVDATIVDLSTNEVVLVDAAGEGYHVRLSSLPEDSDVGDHVAVVHPAGRPREARLPSYDWIALAVLAWLAAGAAVAFGLRLRWVGQVLALLDGPRHARRPASILLVPASSGDDETTIERAEVWPGATGEVPPHERAAVAVPVSLRRSGRSPGRYPGAVAGSLRPFGAVAVWVDDEPVYATAWARRPPD